MKTLIYTTTLLIAIMISSCDQTQKVIKTAENVNLNGNYTVLKAHNKDLSEKQLTLTFDALNKSMSAQTECNQIFGSYEVNMLSITFGPIAATRMYCEGKMEAEQLMSKMLGLTKRYTLEKGILTFYDENNNAVFSASKNKE